MSWALSWCLDPIRYAKAHITWSLQRRSLQRHSSWLRSASVSRHAMTNSLPAREVQWHGACTCFFVARINPLERQGSENNAPRRRPKKAAAFNGRPAADHAAGSG
jgi:hypothetical protein